MSDYDDYDDYGGYFPPYSDDETSYEAAESIRETAETVRNRIEEWIGDAGVEGKICDEIEQDLDLSHQTASARLWELEKLGRIWRPGPTRKTRKGRKAKVYVSSRCIPKPEKSIDEATESLFDLLSDI